MDSSEIKSLDLACPLCKTRLISQSGSSACPSCGKEWPVGDGVRDFRISKDKYWGAYPERRITELNGRCKEIGWAGALKEFLAESDPEYYEYILDEARAHWDFMIPLEGNARVLDAGCGWGTLSFALAKKYREVVAFDVNKPQIEFIQTRARSENIGNLFAACGQVNYLPFPDASFDLAVLNGVLEWVPVIEAGKKPAAAQEEVLREIFRVLKKGGYLYLAIENRWSAINFLGFKDTHSGLRFAPLLPRPLADIYSRFARKKDFREYTYTYDEQKRILRKAGFSGADFYAPLPSYRNFYYLLPVECASRVRFFVENLLYARNKLQAFFIGVVKALFLHRYVKYFVPDFSIVARK
jgi:ubiquinone/menaquinone biosynthesis C-methylase UbiE